MKKYLVRYHVDFIRWLFNDKYHRDKDLPAGYGKNYITYYQHGKIHRITGPAIISYKDKIKRYYYHSKKCASLEEVQMLEACK